MFDNDIDRAEQLSSFLSVTRTRKGNVRKILGTSVKVKKGEKKGVLTSVLYLSASNRSGHNVCPFATEGCIDLCLGHNTGRLRMNTAQESQHNKTRYFKEFQKEFLAQLDKEITRHIKKAKKKDYIPAIRLNGTSDILWERLLNMESYDCQFYDYTKWPLNKRFHGKHKIPKNYHLTYSISEKDSSNWYAVEYAKAGFSVAAVVAHTSNKLNNAKLVAQKLSKRGWIDGDETDLRFYDKPGSWVALYAKGKRALNDSSGFVLRYEL